MSTQPPQQYKRSFAVLNERHTSMSWRGSCSDAATGVGGAGARASPGSSPPARAPHLGATPRLLAVLFGRRTRLLDLATEADLGHVVCADLLADAVDLVRVRTRAKARVSGQG